MTVDIPVVTVCVAREEGTVVTYASWDTAPLMDGECEPTCWENLDATVSCMEGEGPAPTVEAPLPPCASEDIEGAPDCYWDASVQGNGTGDSFVWLDGFVIYDEPATEPVPEVIPACTDAIADAGGVCQGPLVTTESTLTPTAPMPDTLAITGMDDVSPAAVILGLALVLAGTSALAFRRWAR